MVMRLASTILDAAPKDLPFAEAFERGAGIAPPKLIVLICADCPHCGLRIYLKGSTHGTQQKVTAAYVEHIAQERARGNGHT